ncbi:MAG: hypothetical protein ACYTEU_09645 [Planctomycetota bacterium]
MTKKGSPNIKLLICGLLAGVVALALVNYLFNVPEQTAPESDFFPVYGIDPKTRNIVDPDILYYVKIPNSIPLLYRVQMLADNISRIQFGRLPITVMEIEVRQNQKIAIINLNDSKMSMGKHHTWRDIFQEPAYEMSTTTTLITSFLQKDYQDEWIDGVEFLYNGEPFSSNQWNDFHLEGTFIR